MGQPAARRLPESTRVEALSDGVLAIAVTLLVLDLRTDFEPGTFAHQLGAQWPSYAAYVAAFLNVSSIWINHHDLFTRVRSVDATLITLNLVILLVASLFPWPAGVVSASQRSGDASDQVAASLLYAGIGFLVPLSFIAVYRYLARHPNLLTEPAQVTYVRAATRRALVSIVVFPLTAALAFLSPYVALALFIAVPAFFIATVFLQERADDADADADADDEGLSGIG